MPPDDVTTVNAPASAARPARSLVLFNRHGAKAVTQPVGATLVVGRAWPADVVIDDRSLSRRHAQFVAREDGVAFEDLGSTNGTWCNGERTPSGRLKPDEPVRIGQVTVTLHIVASRTPAAGLIDYDRFVAALEDEVRRAQTFGRPVAALLVRADAGPRAHVSHWAAALGSLLRPVDRIAPYAAPTTR